ncbi:jg18964 [Pararge aegeria aegeria]|uniref:Jg18964 protein n=1 Tax=Pararge aegeria aegeria TaxID=348720 RepID=A0A8S4SRT7_9NEOP|nr:jg18964 [Pararge aegeria aegeria]
MHGVVIVAEYLHVAAEEHHRLRVRRRACGRRARGRVEQHVVGAPVVPAHAPQPQRQHRPSHDRRIPAPTNCATAPAVC